MSDHNPEGLPGRLPGEEQEPSRQDVRRDATGNIANTAVTSTSGTSFTTADVTTTPLATTIAGQVFETVQTFSVTGLGTNTVSIRIRRDGNTLTSATGTASVTVTTSTTFTNGTRSPSVEHQVTGLTGGTGTVGTALASREARNRAYN